MGVINLTNEEKRALKVIDEDELGKLIEQAIWDGRSGALSGMPLRQCGTYVGINLHYFEQAVADHGRAKAAKKRAETLYDAEDAGRKLSYAVGDMKHRMETEEKEGELFRVDDRIMWPSSFSSKLDVRVSYQWRRAPADQWEYGSIRFTHEVKIEPDLRWPAPKRTPSPAKMREELRHKLSQRWESLRDNALCSVRDYLRDGGDGNKIPDDFQVRVDSQTGGLNNYSTEFWLERP